MVDYGFRLPSAFDNRPLKFEEFEKYFNNVIFVSATPGKYELSNNDNLVEQVVRPTGLVDPQIEIRETKDQIEDLIKEINKRVCQKPKDIGYNIDKKDGRRHGRIFIKKRYKSKIHTFGSKWNRKN